MLHLVTKYLGINLWYLITIVKHFLLKIFIIGLLNNHCNSCACSSYYEMMYVIDMSVMSYGTIFKFRIARFTAHTSLNIYFSIICLWYSAWQIINIYICKKNHVFNRLENCCNLTTLKNFSNGYITEIFKCITFDIFNCHTTPTYNLINLPASCGVVDHSASIWMRHLL